MAALENFHKIFGKGDQCARPSPSDIKRYRRQLDEELLKEWQERGWCSYSDGAFWFVRPDDFSECLAEWFPKSKDRKGAVVFARSGFGDLLFLRNKEIQQLNVHDGRYVTIGGSSLGRFIDLQINRSYVDIAMDGKLTKKAVRKLGELASDEMFTFEPALALGGARKLEYVAKVKMMPHLSFLSQLFDKVTEFSL